MKDWEILINSTTIRLYFPCGSKKKPAKKEGFANKKKGLWGCDLNKIGVL